MRLGGAVLLGERAAQGWPEVVGAALAALVVVWFLSEVNRR